MNCLCESCIDARLARMAAERREMLERDRRRSWLVLIGTLVGLSLMNAWAFW